MMTLEALLNIFLILRNDGEYREGHEQVDIKTVHADRQVLTDKEMAFGAGL